MNTIETYEFPGKTIRLELPLEGEQTASNDTVGIALDAARRIAGDDLRFHCMDVLIGTFDPELLYALNDLVEDGSTFLFKKMESPPALVCGKIWVDQQTVSLEEFDWNTLEKATLQILTDWPQGKASEAIVLWKNIEFRGVKARIRGVGDPTLKVRWMNRELDFPVENDGADGFVYGPRSDTGIPEPLTIALENNVAWISMRITRFWSYWIDKDQEGTRLLQSSVQQLLDAGWKIRTH
jgi:hypothetical protein